MEFTGWERLLIVLSVLFGVPSAMIAYDQNDEAYAYVSYSIDELGNTAFWQKARTEPALKNCQWPTANAQYNQYGKDTTIRCDNDPPYGEAIKWFFLPGIVMWFIGAVLGWVISGFRKPKSA